MSRSIPAAFAPVLSPVVAPVLDRARGVAARGRLSAWRRGALALGLALATGLAAAAVPEPAFEAAYQPFMAALQGHESSIATAHDRFTALLAQDPGNPLLLAYSGAATAMQARTTMLPWKKMGYAEDGLAQIDKALALLQPAHDAPAQRGTPASLETRFVAASTFLGLPSMFNRGARGAALLAEVQSSPLFDAAPAGFRSLVLIRAARHAADHQRPDDARHLLQQVIDQQLPGAGEARQQLAGLSQ